MASRRQDGVRFAAPAGACRPINRQTSRGWKAAYFAGVPAERGRVLVRRAPLELWASMENWHLTDTPSGEKKLQHATVDGVSLPLTVIWRRKKSLAERTLHQNGCQVHFCASSGVG